MKTNVWGYLKSFFLALMMSVLSISFFARASEAPVLRAIPIPFSDDLHWALLNADNDLVVPPEKLSWVGVFVDMGNNEVRARAKAGSGKWGYLDGEGRWLTEPLLDEARAFAPEEGLARARQGELWGYIQIDGNWGIKPKYQVAYPFSHGFAAVAENDDRDYFFIDSTGKKAFEGHFSDARDFGEKGMAPIAKDGLWGYVDQTGKVAIEPQFDHAFPFNSHGIARVEVKPKVGSKLSVGAKASDDELYGVIDTKGEWVIPPKFKYLWEYNSHGLAWGQWEEKRFLSFGGSEEMEGYIDTNGELVWKTYYGNYHDLINGLMCNHGHNFQFFSPRGKIAIAEHSRWADSFRDASVTIALRDSWGILYRDGRFSPFGPEFLEPLLDSEARVIGFQDGLLAGVTRDRNIAYYDRQGKRQFTLAREAEGLSTLRDANGKVLWRGASLAVPARAVLDPGPEDHFFDPDDWDGGIVALAEQLIAKPPRAFFPRYPREGKIDFYEFAVSDIYSEYQSVDQLPHGAYKLLAHSYLDETFLFNYDYLWRDYPFFGKDYFMVLRKQLVGRFGEPVRENDHRQQGRDAVFEVVWRLDGRYLVLRSIEATGDGDLTQFLLLAVVEHPSL